jgi:hypothetical protein
MNPQLKPRLWLPVTVFLAVSIPLVWLLEAAGVDSQYRVWLAIAAGALATGLTQSRLAAKAEQAAPQSGRQSGQNSAKQSGEHA